MKLEAKVDEADVGQVRKGHARPSLSTHSPTATSRAWISRVDVGAEHDAAPAARRARAALRPVR